MLLFSTNNRKYMNLKKFLVYDMCANVEVNKSTHYLNLNQRKISLNTS